MKGDIMKKIHDELLAMQDISYRGFQSKLIPSVPIENMIGVRTPKLRSLAKRMLKDGTYEEFLAELPHRYFDENQLHAFVISGLKDLDECITSLNAFLPYVDNWATCDQMSPKVFAKHKVELLDLIKKWIKSDEVYTVRFAIGMLMQHYLDSDFSMEYLEMVADVSSEEYYVRMMVAWYFATALAKQYDDAIVYLEKSRLEPWIHNKTIQKAIESNRISDEKKEYLRGLKNTERGFA